MKPKKYILTIVAMLSISCAGTLSPNQQAIATTATNLARIAVSAAATYYGGPAAGQLASAGLDGLASVIQSYVGHPIPSGIVTASPGVSGVGAELVTLIAPDHKVTQADADKVALAARIAKTLAPAITTPKR